MSCMQLGLYIGKRMSVLSPSIMQCANAETKFKLLGDGRCSNYLNLQQQNQKKRPNGENFKKIIDRNN